MEPDLSDFIAQQSKYVYDPLKWAYDMLRFEPDAWQEKAFKSEKNFVAISSGSGVGKTAYLAIRALHFLSTRPFPKVPCTAKSQHQLFDILWAEVSKWLRRNELLSKAFKWTQTKVSLRGHEEEWFMVARTANPKPGETSTEGLQGFHADHLLFLIDEASGVPDQIMGAVDGALTNKNCHAVLASNPTRKSGYFYRIITDERFREFYDVFFVNAEDAKYVDQVHLARTARIYGRDSDYYRVKVLGLPPLADAYALITPEQVYAAHVRQIEINPSDFCVLSCDPARFGDDSSVFYVRKGMVFVDRKEIRGMDTTQVTKILVDLVELHGVDLSLVDEIGIGAGVADQSKAILTKRWEQKKIAKPCEVRGINVGCAATEPDGYYNLRAEIFWKLKQYVDQVSLPLDTELLDEELTTIKYGWDTKDLKIKLESKDEIKRRLGRSPNDADSFAINISAEFISHTMHVSSTYFKMGAKPALSLATAAASTFLPGEEAEGGLVVGFRPSSTGLVGSARYAHFNTR